jgi:hypothetical protein
MEGNGDEKSVRVLYIYETKYLTIGIDATGPGA